MKCMERVSDPSMRSIVIQPTGGMMLEPKYYGFHKGLRKYAQKYGSDATLAIQVILITALLFTMIGFTLCLSWGKSCMNVS